MEADASASKAASAALHAPESLPETAPAAPPAEDSLAAADHASVGPPTAANTTATTTANMTATTTAHAASLQDEQKNQKQQQQQQQQQEKQQQQQQEPPLHQQPCPPALQQLLQQQQPLPSSANTSTSSTPNPHLQQRPRVAARDRFNHQSLGPSLNLSVKQARVLMVGAGGIGCELLKNLALNGFGEIHIVDLDTIDLSNLNRQFLFRQEHIKKPKALVAKETAQRFNPNAQIVAHHANIKDAEFTVSWFRGFAIVFNALDNLDARRHVNKMCLAADVPLIESGTAGFNGQVQVIKKGVTACYDCTPKETPKTFPVCTIRSTPSQPIHCIVWGKSYLLNEIFGASEDESAFDHSSDADNAKEIAELKRESQELKRIREAVGTDAFAQMLFDKVFDADIERLRSVEDMWKSRRRPSPLKYEELLSQAGDAVAEKDQILSNGQKVWSLQESLVVFRDSLDRLSKRMLQLKEAKEPSGPEPIITFDKDDEDTLDFVASSANIRSTIFGIDRKSRFDIKQMAGNIIPAIATTNAVVAGLCVLESLKVLRGAYARSKEVFLTPFAPARLLAPDRSRGPNAGCPVCSVFNMSISIDPRRATLNDVVEDIIRGVLGFGDRDFAVSNEVGILYDPDETDNLCKKLCDLGVNGSSFLTVTDEDDDEPFVNAVIDIQQGETGDDEKPVKSLLAEPADVPRKRTKPEANGQGRPNGEHPIDGSVEPEQKSLKRRLPEDDNHPSKKARVEVATDGAVLVDEGGGAIVIDD